MMHCHCWFFFTKGENRHIESICQTIFRIPELLRLLTNQNISNNFKQPILRFFLWVYLNTSGGMIESGVGNMPHDKYVTWLISVVLYDLYIVVYVIALLGAYTFMNFNVELDVSMCIAKSIHNKLMFSINPEKWCLYIYCLFILVKRFYI